MSEDLFAKVKETLTDITVDDALLRGFVNAAISYAEKYQKFSLGTYTCNPIGERTRAAIIKLAHHYYISGLGNTSVDDNKDDVLRDINTLLWEGRNDHI